MEATVKEQELEQLLRFEQIKELSSEEENPREEAVSRSQYRKPIKNSYSDQEDSASSSDSPNKGETPLPSKPPKGKSALQQAQEEIRWTKEETTEEDLLSKLEGTGMKDRKIRELANKCKTLNLALQRERTARRQAEQQLNATIKANEQAKRQEEGHQQSMEKTSASKEGRCAGCQEQQRKVMDFRQKLQAAKSELNKAHRLIAREIGQNVDIDQALGEENGWKGRQQKIEKLKGRVRQLEERLAAGGANVSHMSGFTQISTPTGQSQLSATQRTSTLADNKRKELENLKVQAQALRTENELLQGKVKSLASRNFTLQAKVKEMKGEYDKQKQIFVEKSENDDRFIALLKQQNEKLKKEERVVTKVVYKEGKDTNEDADAARREADTLKKKLKELTKANQELTKLNQELSKFAQQKEEKPKEEKVIKAVNEVREISADHCKQLEEEYLKGNKYLKKLSTEDEQEIYRAWKESKGKI